MLIVKKIEKFYYLTFPKITTIITSGTYENGNAMAASWTTPVSFDPPLIAVAISPKRYTYELIRKFGEYGVNILSFEKLDIVEKTGYYSGRDFNKFDHFGIRKMRAKKIESPLIADAICVMECVVKKTINIGDHDLFVGEVVETWVNPEYVDDKGRIKIDKISPIFHYGGKDFVGVDGRNIVTL
ncbi:MAG: flavin reductase family protein [Candidatus Njordarchaeia archaeon]